MVKIPFRRVTTLLFVLALFAGPAVGFMPLATASPAMDMVGPGSSSNDGCLNCTPAKMAFADCDTICVSPVAIFLPIAITSAAAGVPHWRWVNEPMRCCTIEPATAPPRS